MRALIAYRPRSLAFADSILDQAAEMRMPVRHTYCRDLWGLPRKPRFLYVGLGFHVPGTVAVHRLYPKNIVAPGSSNPICWGKRATKSDSRALGRRLPFLPSRGSRVVRYTVEINSNEEMVMSTEVVVIRVPEGNAVVKKANSQQDGYCSREDSDPNLIRVAEHLQRGYTVIGITQVPHTFYYHLVRKIDSKD